jgi:nucleotide-binding universal stress UspA family protein
MFKRIMVPIETKEKSEVAIRIAYDMAELHKSEVILFNVINPKSLLVDTELEEAAEDEGEETEKETGKDEKKTPEEILETLTDIQREERRKALEEDRYKMLYSILRTAPNDRMKVFIDIVEGDPATKISEMARKNKVELIIMPKSGKIGPRRVLVGDIALKVAEITEIPLMLIAS